MKSFFQIGQIVRQGDDVWLYLGLTGSYCYHSSSLWLSMNGEIIFSRTFVNEKEVTSGGCDLL